jgi:hypothetical protein
VIRADQFEFKVLEENPEFHIPATCELQVESLRRHLNAITEKVKLQCIVLGSWNIFCSNEKCLT